MLAELAKVALTPFAAALALALLALVLLRHHRSAGILASALVILVVFSLPITAKALLFSLEKHYPPLALNEYAAPDVIAVMGGGVSHNGHRAALARSGDRLLLAFLLQQQHPSAELWVSHGIDAHAQQTGSPNTAADLLLAWGVPSNRLKTLSDNENTVSEVKLLVQRFASHNDSTGTTGTLAVVTSATHMSRVEAQFKRAGVPIMPAAANHWIARTKKPLQLMDFVPSAISLGGSTRAINEYLAHGVCRLKNDC